MCERLRAGEKERGRDRQDIPACDRWRREVGVSCLVGGWHVFPSKPVTKWRAVAPRSRGDHSHRTERYAEREESRAPRSLQPLEPQHRGGDQNRATSEGATFFFFFLFKPGERGALSAETPSHSSSRSADMGVTSPPLLLICIYLTAVGRARSEGVCLQDGKHKATPGAEPRLSECGLYADNSCCTEEDIQDIAYVPSDSNKNEPWDKCGPLSSECEGYLKRVSCFYRCSPDASRWPHPHRRSYIQAVPLCHSFCRDWFDACRMDMTCARNWARDPRGQNCTGTCVQYQQMYQHGRDLCESLWGDAFMTVEDDQQEAGENGAEGRPCGCLTLSPSDKDVIAALRAQQDDPEELDTTKAGLPQYRAPCRAKMPAPAKSGRRANSVLRKRSVEIDDVEGSGSGL